MVKSSPLVGGFPILYPSRPLRVHSLEVIRGMDPEVVSLQFKANGHHAVVSTHGTGEIFSRRGDPLAAAGFEKWSDVCSPIFGMDTMLDGELIGPPQGWDKTKYQLILWDIPVFRGRDLTKNLYHERLKILDNFKTDFVEPWRHRIHHNVWIMKSFQLQDLDWMLDFAKNNSEIIEGIVAKARTHNLSWSRLSQQDCPSQIKFRLKG